MNIHYNYLQPSWIDLAMVGFIVVGMVIGRKRGISAELLDVVKWLIIIVAGAFLYDPIGTFVSDMSPFTLLSCYVGTYIGIITVVLIFFGTLKRSIGDRILNSDTFGAGEYYLGILGGGFRHVCIIFAVMALINARYYSQAEITKRNDSQMHNFGMTFYSMYQFQGEMFGKSFVGQATRKHLPLLLIRQTAPSTKPLGHKSRSVRAREDSVKDILD